MAIYGGGVSGHQYDRKLKSSARDGFKNREDVDKRKR
jgi:hypothetical protein